MFVLVKEVIGLLRPNIIIAPNAQGIGENNKRHYSQKWIRIQILMFPYSLLFFLSPYCGFYRKGLSVRRADYQLFVYIEF